MKIIQWSFAGQKKWQEHEPRNHNPEREIRRLKKTEEINGNNNWTPAAQRIIYRIKTI